MSSSTAFFLDAMSCPATAANVDMELSPSHGQPGGQRELNHRINFHGSR